MKHTKRAYIAAQLYDDQIERIKISLRLYAEDTRRLERELLQLEAAKHVFLSTQRPWRRGKAA